MKWRSRLDRIAADLEGRRQTTKRDRDLRDLSSGEKREFLARLVLKRFALVRAIETNPRPDELREPTHEEIHEFIGSGALGRFVGDPRTYLAIATRFESTGDRERAALLRALAQLALERSIPWQEKVARNLEDEDPPRAARLRAIVANRTTEAPGMPL